MKCIVLGDSHAECFRGEWETYSFPSACAKGLGNDSSISSTNKKITEIINRNKDYGFVFFFGKVDIDFMLNYKFNLNQNFDHGTHLMETARKYINFIKRQNITNVYICELPLSHVRDKHMIKILNHEEHCKKKASSPKYTKCIPFQQRNLALTMFNSELKRLSKANGWKLLEINKYFRGGVIPEKYISSNDLDHHLEPSISQLYINEIRQI